MNLIKILILNPDKKKKKNNFTYNCFKKTAKNQKCIMPINSSKSQYILNIIIGIRKIIK